MQADPTHVASARNSDTEPDAPVVMVVDDTPANLRLLEGALQSQSYRVMAFPSGELALKAAERTPPDIILLDIMMPGMNGYEVCERLKAHDTLKEVPVVFLSALDDTEDRAKAFAVGGADYLNKPFSLKELRARVATHLALRRKQLELQQANARMRELEAL